MKAILEFNLDCPDDTKAHRRAVKALDMALALWDFDSEVLRSATKYEALGERNINEMTPHDIALLIREKFHDYLMERGIDFNELLS